MGTPNIGGDLTGAVLESSGDIITGDLDDIGFLTGNADDVWSVSAASYGDVSIDSSTGTWSYDLNDNHPAVNALDDGDILEDTFTVLMVDSDGRSDTDTVTITITGVPCFVEGSLIETSTGSVPVEQIKPGDLVKTLDAGFEPVLWAGSRALGKTDFHNNPKLRPIKIEAGALGLNKPREDLYVSPQHRVFVDSKIAQRVFKCRQILVPAKKLVDLSGISIVENPGVITYCHILLGDHQVVFSNGALTESLYVGAEALKALSNAARKEIQAIFPEVLSDSNIPEPARPFPENGKSVREFTRRLIKNNQTVLQQAS